MRGTAVRFAGCPGTVRACESELEMVVRHVREGERHVANQREIVAHLREHGHSTETAEKLLTILEDLLEMHRQHLARIRSEQ